MNTTSRLVRSLWSDKTVSVVICTYTDARWSQFADAVASVQTQTRTPDQIVIVVDHNEGLEVRVRAAFPGLVVVSNSGPRGLSGARNSGVAQATGTVIAFIDDDAVGEATWLGRLLDAFADPDVAGAGGIVVPRWESGRPAWFPEEYDWVLGCSYRGMPTSPQRIRNPIGCNMAFRRDIFGVIGGFSTDLGRIGGHPVGAEETELCIRLADRMPGSRVVYIPNAAVHHAVPSSRSTWRYFFARCYAEGLSKAMLGRLAKSGRALSTEWRYVWSTLTLGMLRGLADVVRRRDLMGLTRAFAIGSGLSLTVAGFLVGAVRRSSR